MGLRTSHAKRGILGGDGGDGARRIPQGGQQGISAGGRVFGHRAADAICRVDVHLIAWELPRQRELRGAADLGGAGEEGGAIGLDGAGVGEFARAMRHFET